MNNGSTYYSNSLEFKKDVSVITSLNALELNVENQEVTSKLIAGNILATNLTTFNDLYIRNIYVSTITWLTDIYTSRLTIIDNLEIGRDSTVLGDIHNGGTIIVKNVVVKNDMEYFTNLDVNNLTVLNNIINEKNQICLSNMSVLGSADFTNSGDVTIHNLTNLENHEFTLLNVASNISILNNLQINQDINIIDSANIYTVLALNLVFKTLEFNNLTILNDIINEGNQENNSNLNIYSNLNADSSLINMDSLTTINFTTFDIQSNNINSVLNGINNNLYANNQAIPFTVNNAIATNLISGTVLSNNLSITNKLVSNDETVLGNITVYQSTIVPDVFTISLTSLSALITNITVMADNRITGNKTVLGQIVDSGINGSATIENAVQTQLNVGNIPYVKNATILTEIVGGNMTTLSLGTLSGLNGNLVGNGGISIMSILSTLSNTNLTITSNLFINDPNADIVVNGDLTVGNILQINNTLSFNSQTGINQNNMLIGTNMQISGQFLLNSDLLVSRLGGGSRYIQGNLVNSSTNVVSINTIINTNIQVGTVLINGSNAGSGAYITNNNERVNNETIIGNMSILGNVYATQLSINYLNLNDLTVTSLNNLQQITILENAWNNSNLFVGKSAIIPNLPSTNSLLVQSMSIPGISVIQNANIINAVLGSGQLSVINNANIPTMFNNNSIISTNEIMSNMTSLIINSANYTNIGSMSIIGTAISTNINISNLTIAQTGNFTNATILNNIYLSNLTTINAIILTQISNNNINTYLSILNNIVLSNITSASLLTAGGNEIISNNLSVLGTANIPNIVTTNLTNTQNVLVSANVTVINNLVGINQINQSTLTATYGLISNLITTNLTVPTIYNNSTGLITGLMTISGNNWIQNNLSIMGTNINQLSTFINTNLSSVNNIITSGLTILSNIYVGGNESIIGSMNVNGTGIIGGLNVTNMTITSPLTLTSINVSTITNISNSLIVGGNQTNKGDITVINTLTVPNVNINTITTLNATVLSITGTNMTNWYNSANNITNINALITTAINTAITMINITGSNLIVLGNMYNQTKINQNTIFLQGQGTMLVNSQIVTNLNINTVNGSLLVNGGVTILTNLQLNNIGFSNSSLIPLGTDNNGNIIPNFSIYSVLWTSINNGIYYSTLNSTSGITVTLTPPFATIGVNNDTTIVNWKMDSGGNTLLGDWYMSKLTTFNEKYIAPDTTGLTSISISANPTQLLNNLAMNISNNAIINGNLYANNMNSYRNKIINGAMNINQRGITNTIITGSLTTGTYTVDRFGTYTANIAQISLNNLRMIQSTLSTAETPYLNNGFTNCLVYSMGGTGITISTNGQYIQNGQILSYDMVRDFAWGTQNGCAVTVSFWMRSNYATHSVSLLAKGVSVSGNYYSYVQTFTISTNTWTYVVLTIPPPPTLYYCWNDPTSARNVGKSLQIVFDFYGFFTGVGVQQSGAWTQSTNPIAYSLGLSTNPYGTANNFFAITGVQLERGTIATPFEFRPKNIEMKLCEYYYESLQFNYAQVFRLLYDTFNGPIVMTAIVYPNTIKINQPTLTITPALRYSDCTKVSETYNEPYIVLTASVARNLRGYITTNPSTTNYYILDAEYTT